MLNLPFTAGNGDSVIYTGASYKGTWNGVLVYEWDRVPLVSSTVQDLVAGSGLRFAERGTHALKGVPDEWRLFAVER